MPLNLKNICYLKRWNKMHLLWEKTSKWLMCTGVSSSPWGARRQHPRLLRPGLGSQVSDRSGVCRHEDWQNIMLSLNNLTSALHPAKWSEDVSLRLCWNIYMTNGRAPSSLSVYSDKRPCKGAETDAQWVTSASQANSLPLSADGWMHHTVYPPLDLT